MSTYFADHHRQGFFREKNKKQKIRKKRKRKAEREKWRSAAVFSFVFSSEKITKSRGGKILISKRNWTTTRREVKRRWQQYREPRRMFLNHVIKPLSRPTNQTLKKPRHTHTHKMMRPLRLNCQFLTMQGVSLLLIVYVVWIHVATFKAFSTTTDENFSFLKHHHHHYRPCCMDELEWRWLLYTTLLRIRGETAIRDLLKWNIKTENKNK